MLVVLGTCAVLLVAMFWAGLYLNVQTNNARRHDNCVRDQRIYAGQFAYTRFLARELSATPAQEARALKDLRATVGPRPVC